MALYIGKKVGTPTVIKEIEIGGGETVGGSGSFDLELETVSGRIKEKSIIGSGSTESNNIIVTSNDDRLQEIDIEIQPNYDIKSNEDYVVGFTDDVLFYDCIKENPTDLVNIHPLEITFPNGAVYSHKYNKQINYKSKTVYFYDYTDNFDYPNIGYEDDGSEVLMNMYAIYNDATCEIVLLNRIMTPSDVPSGFTDYMLIKQITIPAHTPFHAEIVQQPWTNPILTSNGTMGGDSPACDAYYTYSSSYNPYRAFDNSTSTDWRSDYSDNTWITYYTPTPIYITSVVFSFYSTAAAGRIEGSNDNSSWVTIGSFTGNTSSTLTVECSTTTPYKYIRFYRTSTYSGSGGRIYDMKINGYTLGSKWYSKTLLTHIINNGQNNPESFINGSYYSSSSKLVECSSQPLITTNMYEDGCLFKYDDTGYGDLNTKSYVVKNVDSDVYKIAITDKTIAELQGDETIDYAEEVGNFVLPSHYNFDYDGGEPTPNFNIYGESLTETDGVYSGFTASNYLRIIDEFNPGDKPWELMTKVTTGSNMKASEYWFGSENGDNGLLIAFQSGYLCWYLSSNGSSWDIASYQGRYNATSSTTTYLVRASYDLATYKLEVSTNNGETWTTVSTINSTLKISPCYLFIGSAWDKSSSYLDGSIDLNETYIKVDGKYWWTAYSLPFTLKDQFQSSCNFLRNDEPNKFNIIANESIGIQPKEQNFTVVGTLTDNDGVFSGFTSNSYIKMKNEIPSGNKEIVFKMNIGNDVSTLQNIFSSFDTNKNSNIYIQSGKLSYWTTSGYGSYSVSSNTGYWMHIIVSNNTTNLYILTDNNYTHESLPTTGWTTITSISGDAFGNNLMCFGCDGGGSYPFLGSIELNESYIKVNDELWWKGYIGNYFYNNTSIAPYTLVDDKLVGCLVNYEDNGSANILKAYKVTYTDNNVGVVLSNDESFTVENMDTKTYLADIVIPRHNLFTYGEKTVQTPWENPKLTANGTVGGTSNACQSSGYYDTSYYPYRAFDKNTNEQWHSNGNKPQWITYYTPTAIYVDTIKILLSSYNPFFFEIHGSNNNTDWDILVDDMNKNNTSGQTIEIPVNSENPYKYIRLLNKKGYNSSYTTVNEMYIYGHTINSENGWIRVGE